MGALFGKLCLGTLFGTLFGNFCLGTLVGALFGNFVWGLCLGLCLGTLFGGFVWGLCLGTCLGICWELCLEFCWELCLGRVCLGLLLRTLVRTLVPFVLLCRRSACGAVACLLAGRDRSSGRLLGGWLLEVPTVASSPPRQSRRPIRRDFRHGRQLRALGCQPSSVPRFVPVGVITEAAGNLAPAGRDPLVADVPNACGLPDGAHHWTAECFSRRLFGVFVCVVGS